MANRLKRVFSTVLCAMVLLTMTAVPGTAFAETTDEPEKAAQTETQALASENEAGGVTQKQETTQFESQEEAKAPAQESTAAAPQAKAQSSESKAKAVDTQAARAATGVQITTVENKTTFCIGTSTTLTAEIQNKTFGRTYTYKWFKDGDPISGAKSTKTVDASGVYTVEVTEHVIGTNPTFTASVSISFVAHDLEWKQNGGYHWQDCKNCDKYNSGNAEKHTLTLTPAIPETCTENGQAEYWTCSKCKMMFSDEKGTIQIDEPVVIPAAHKLKAVEKKDATCTENGYEAYWKCSECDKMFSDENGTNPIAAPVVIPAAHKLDAVPEKNANCTDDGYKAHWKCSACGKLFADNQAASPLENPEIIPATGHNVVWHYAGNNAEKCAKYCTTCRTFLSELIDHDIAYKKTSDTTHMKYCERCNSNLKSEEHTWEADYTVDQEPTCTTAGSKSKHCEKCNAKTEVTEIPAAHTWAEDLTVDKESTCIAEGIQSRHCQNCDATKDEQTIAKLPHNMTKTNAKAATCTASGNNEYYTCKTCNLVFKDEAGTTPTTAAAEITEPIAHDLTKTEAKPATCTENGHKAYWTCGSCGQLFADENGKTAIEKPEVIEATGHTLNLVPQKDATCTEEGYEAYWKCDVCDHMFTSKEASEALDAPVVIPATGHKFGEWKVVKEPTVEEAGMKERVCEKCSYTETAAIPALQPAKADLTGKTELNKTKETADKSDNSAKTGDDMNVALYSLLALLAAGGAAGAAYRRRTSEK